MLKFLWLIEIKLAFYVICHFFFGRLKELLDEEQQGLGAMKSAIKFKFGGNLC